MYGGLAGLFKISSNILWFDIPDYFDTLNRSILEQLKEDLKDYYNYVEKEKIDSFTYDEEKLSKDELTVFKQICEYAIQIKQIRINNHEWIESSNKNEIILSLNDLNFFSSIFINMLNQPMGFTINPNSFYAYLQNYFSDFEKVRLKLITKIRTLESKSHFLSKDIANELEENPIIINSFIYQFDRKGILKCYSNINGGYWIYEINKDELEDCL